MRKTEKYTETLLVGHTQMTPRERSRKKAAEKPTQTNEQQRHEVEEAASGQSNEEKTIPDDEEN